MIPGGDAVGVVFSSILIGSWQWQKQIKRREFGAT